MIPRILVVDDERQIRRALKEGLVAEGFVALTAETGEEASTPRPDSADLVILDLGLPGITGLEVCRAIRARSRAPILILSVRSSEREKVAALNLGADDYLTKPFGMEELLARVRAHLRRWKDNAQPEQPFQAGDLTIDFAARVARLRGEEVRLTRTEWEILRFLALNAGRVVTHGMILQHVRGTAYEEDVQALRVHVAHLRRKIERDPARPRYLLTEIGVGYRFALPPEPPPTSPDP